MSTVTVSVPSTTANLGPGFDCLGVALTLSNQFNFSQFDGENIVAITATGSESDRIKTDRSNLVYRAFVRFYQHLKQPVPSVQIEIQLGVPLARGLGSSATAIVGGLLGANALAECPLSQADILELAVEIEGHPDNVVPALLGGCRLATTGLDVGWEVCDIPWHPNVVPVVAIPSFELSTHESRQVLPADYSRADSIFNTAHLGLLIRGLETGKGDWLKAGLQDKIHQPYRQALIPGYGAVRSAALEAGAYGLVISGAGPTLLALSDSTTASSIQTAMMTAWADAGVSAQVCILQVNQQGAISSPDYSKL